MPRTKTLRDVIAELVDQAVARAISNLEARIESLIDRRFAQELGLGAGPARAPRRKRAPHARKRNRGEMTHWVADKRARRVPLFVIAATGLDTKKAIVKKYGENAAFAKGKPLPKAA
jgi:hypothetical protein